MALATPNHLYLKQRKQDYWIQARSHLSKIALLEIEVHYSFLIDLFGVNFVRNKG